LIAAAVAGGSPPEIAAAAGVSESTVQRRLRDPHIAAAVQEGRTQQHREAVGRLNNRMPAAIDRLAVLVTSEDPNVALRAIGMVLNSAHKFTIDLHERFPLFEANHLDEED
jgi:hypothetical protein